MTKSENLFEDYCALHNLALFKCVIPSSLPGRNVSRSADYVFVAQGNPIVSEVKQIEFGPEEALVRESSRDELGKFVPTEPGRRVRKAIDDAVPQLRQTSCGVTPTLLVLFDNSGGYLDRLDPYEILVGMYGLEQVVFAVPKQSAQPAVPVAHKFGPKQKVAPTFNTTLSAVGVLRSDAKLSLTFDIYHSDFAARRIEPDWLRLETCSHWRREPTPDQNVYREWVKI